MTLRAQALVGMALLAVAALAQAAPYGYVVNSDSVAESGFDALYRVDLASGEATLVGPTGYADIEGLAFSPEGTLYGVDDATGTLVIIDTETGGARPVDNQPGNLGLERAIYDFGLTFDAKGRLWLSSDTTGRIWRVDPQTGHARLVVEGTPPTEQSTGHAKSAENPGYLSALAACGPRVYGVGVTGDERLYRLTDNRSLKRVGALQAGLRFTDAGTAFAPDGTLWGVGSTRKEPSRIFKIDPTSGRATRVAETIVGVESLAIASPPTACGQQQNAEQGATAVPTASPFTLALLGLLLAGTGVWITRKR